MQHRTRTIGGALIVVTGGVWMAQGSGLLQGSGFMVGDPTWLVLGAIGVVVGLALIWVGLRGQA
jgi:hypothetical protein